MENVREIKSHIKGVENTQKITKAVKIMSQIRFQRAEKRALSARPYFFRLRETISQIAATLSAEEIKTLPLFEERSGPPAACLPARPRLSDGQVPRGMARQGRAGKSILFVIFTSDRGLCGSFNSKLNTQLLDRVESQKAEGSRFKFIAVGKKGLAFLKRAGFEVISSYTSLPPIPTVSLTNLIVNECLAEFESGGVDEVWVAYNHYASVSERECAFFKFLPISYEDFLSSRKVHMNEYLVSEYIYEPSKKEILKVLLPHYLEVGLLQILFESYASEYAARMLAMDLATNNAQSMISELTLKYYKSRQATITTEILEVVTAAEEING